MRISTVAIMALAAVLASDLDSQASIDRDFPLSPIPESDITPIQALAPVSTASISAPEIVVAQNFTSDPVIASSTLTPQDVQELRQLILAVADDGTGGGGGSYRPVRNLDYSITLLNTLLVILATFPFATIILFFAVRKLVVKDFVEDVKKQLNKIGELENYLSNYSETANGYLEKLDKEISTHKQKLNDELQAIVNRSEMSKASIQQIEALKSQFMMHLQVMVSEAQAEKERIFQEIHQIKPSLTLDSRNYELPQPNGATRQVTLQKLQQTPPALTAEYYFKQGEILLQERRYEEAIASYEKATQMRPNFYEAWFCLAHVLGEAQRYQDAVTAYDRANELNPNRYEAWYNRGNTLGKIQRYEEAIASYEKAMQLNPKRFEIWYNIGSVFKRLERYEEAVTAYNKAIEISPNQSQIWYNRGNALASLQQHADAIASYDKALEIDDRKPEAWFNRGVTLEKVERYEEAISSYDRALELNASDLEIWCKRAEALEKLERYEEAISAYDKVLSSQPKNAAAWCKRGLVLEILQRHEEALVAYDKALEINPNSPENWRYRGAVLAELKRYQEAVVAFSEAMQAQENLNRSQEKSPQISVKA